MGDQAHETGKNHKRDPRETGKYELWANSGKQRTMPANARDRGDGEARRRGLDKGRDREGAHGGTGKWGKMNGAGEGEKQKAIQNRKQIN